jgi:hypothetical protein
LPAPPLRVFAKLRDLCGKSLLRRTLLLVGVGRIRVAIARLSVVIGIIGIIGP